MTFFDFSVEFYLFGGENGRGEGECFGFLEKFYEPQVKNYKNLGAVHSNFYSPPDPLS